MTATASRRELLASLGLVAVGGSLVLVAAGRPWSERVVQGAGVPAVRTLRDGTDIALAAPLGLLCLAGVVGLLAARAWLRRAVAVLVLAAGGTVGALSAAFLAASADDRRVAWPLVCLAGAVLVVTGAAIAVVRGGRWPAMSGRYERGAAAATPARPQGLWDALDAGVDPTEGERTGRPAR